MRTMDVIKLTLQQKVKQRRMNTLGEQCTWRTSSTLPYVVREAVGLLKLVPPPAQCQKFTQIVNVITSKIAQ